VCKKQKIKGETETSWHVHKMQEMKCEQHGNTDRTMHQRKQIFVVVVMGLLGR
jgi:hypothetical protein